MAESGAGGRFLSVAFAAFAATLSTLACNGCGSIAVGTADQAAVRATPEKALSTVEAPPGFRVVLAAEGLNYPSAMDWDEQGRLFVLQSHSVPLPLTGVKVVRIDPDGKIADVVLDGPGAPTGKVAVGLVYHEGFFYLSHEQEDGSWGISRFRPEGGATEAVLRDLPVGVDHWANHLAFDRDGNLYFGLGSATNSGVVSSNDPVNLKWLEARPAGRDIPCKDITLLENVFTDDNALTPEDDDQATTGAFQAYGNSGASTVKGEDPCTSSVYKLAPGADEPELVAWGFRNPVGLAVSEDGTVFVASQGADVRGTRPVLDDPDAIYRLVAGGWYGWPDFAADFSKYTDPSHAVAAEHAKGGGAGPVALLDLAKSGLEPPDKRWLVYATEPHAAVCGITVVPSSGPFAQWAGQVLVSEMGDFRPTTDPLNPDVRAGFQVEAIDPRSGQATVFLRNAETGKDGSSLPASTLDLEDGLERPVDVRIGPDGMVYVLDFGVWVPTPEAGKVFPKTGRIFRIEPVGGE